MAKSQTNAVQRLNLGRDYRQKNQKIAEEEPAILDFYQDCSSQVDCRFSGQNILADGDVEILSARFEDGFGDESLLSKDVNLGHDAHLDYPDDLMQYQYETVPSNAASFGLSSTVEEREMRACRQGAWCEELAMDCAEDVCCASNCLADSCPTCQSSCYEPCMNPEDCSSATCREPDCCVSPVLCCADHYIPMDSPLGFAEAKDDMNPIIGLNVDSDLTFTGPGHCDWLGNGENCEASLTSLNQCVQHITENHIKNQSQVECQWNNCGLETDVRNLSQHLWSDHRPAPQDLVKSPDQGHSWPKEACASYVCLWLDCEQSFPTHEQLDEHFKTVHCHIDCHWAGCAAVTYDESELLEHFNQEHFPLIDENALSDKQSTPPKPEASDPTSLPVSLSDHRGHPSSATHSSLRLPRNSHDEKYPSEVAGTKSCMWVLKTGAVCGVSCEDGNSLQEHVRNAHIKVLAPKELACGWQGCDFVASKDKNKLVRHMHTHTKCKCHRHDPWPSTNDRKDCFGACKHCKKEFSDMRKLIDHENAHEGGRPFACSKCDLSFTRKQDLSP